MYRSIVTAFLLSSFSALPVLAEQKATNFKADTRIKKYTYNETEVYKLNLHLKAVSAIQFSEDENVQSILLGDSASWEVVKLQSGNVISIKPIINGALTNMTVYTNERVYTFELSSVGEIRQGPNQGADQAFRAVFIYPNDGKAKKADTEGSFSPGPVNTNYLVSGDGDFRPVAVSDNRFQTTFELQDGAPRPAIFKVGRDKKERLVNSRTKGNLVIVDGTSNYWVMRIGDEMVCVGKDGAVRERFNVAGG